MDTLNCISDIWYRLGFLNLAELQEAAPAPWVSETELFNFMDEGVKRLAYEVGLFAVTDSSVPITGGAAVCQLPATHVFTLLAAVVTLTGGSPGTGTEWGTLAWGTVPWGGTGPFAAPSTFKYSLLRLTSVRDLWALDGTWPVTTGTPSRGSLDAGTPGTFTLYPIPVASGLLFEVCQEFPNVSATASGIQIPTVCQDYLSYCALAGAKAKESEQADGAIADHYKQRMALYEEVFDHLFGAGQ